MVTWSTSDGRRQASRRDSVSFDRIALDELSFPDLPHELSRNVQEHGIATLTWAYDRQTDVVAWSSSVEEFFGFEDGTPGFIVHRDASTLRPRPVPSLFELTDDGPVLVPGPVLSLGPVDPADIGASLLEPVLGPLRAGVPLMDVDLRTRVICPDRSERHLVIRAGALRPGGATPPPFDPDRVVTGVLVDVTSQEQFEQELGDMVDRYRLLTEVSPDLVIVHQDGNLVYGNRAAVRYFGATTMMEYYGRAITDFVHPDDLGPVAERLAQLTEDGQFVEHGEARILSPTGASTSMEATSIRTTWAGAPAYQVVLRDVSARKEAEAAAQYRASLVAHVSDAIIGIDGDGHIESWNQAAQAIYGWTEPEVLGHSIGAVVSANRSESAATLERGQHVHRRKDGSSVDVLISIDPLIDKDLQPSGWVIVCTELTDARQAEAGRRAAEARYEAIVASLSEGIILFDANGAMTAHNEAATAILGPRLVDAVGIRMFTGAGFATTADGQPMSDTEFPHVRTLATGQSMDTVVIGVTDADGSRQWLSVSARLLSGADGTDSPMVVCSFTDVTARRAAEAQLHWLAYHDSLTGLGNRSYVNDELERELLISMQQATNLAVLFVDLDRFKLVNDSFGHASGDELLLELARRFKSIARPGDIVSRFSGDEFVVVCPNVADAEAAVGLAEQYSTVTEQPFVLRSGRSVTVSCSVGVSFVVQGRQRAQDILQQADTAMFQAKNKGRARIEVFDESLRVNSVARLEIYDDLRHSIEHDELVVHYQPIASVGDGHIVAMEALVRWNHPTRGLLGPMEFIPFAEETDLIFSLGRWVLREACTTMARWRTELPGAEDAYITVNLSVHQLSDPNLLTTIADALADSGLPADALVLEVTESLLMSETTETVAALNGIHEMGVGLAIDDFGTGESSLARLKRFPVKVLKIDKSFVDGLGILDTDEAIVAAIVQLSKALGLTVLAEGVETPSQLERVASLGCDLYQGYLMSRPIGADHVDFLKKVESTPQTDLPA